MTNNQTEKPVKKRIRKPKVKPEVTILTPQQQLFLSYLIDPSSESFGNYYQSAIRAKYKKSYALNITHSLPNWLLENVGDMTRLLKAEKVLDETLDISHENAMINKKGKVITFKDPKILKIKQDTAKFFAQTLGKRKYSLRTEHTGKDGGAIETKVNYDELTDEELKSELARRNNTNT